MRLGGARSGQSNADSASKLQEYWHLARLAAPRIQRRMLSMRRSAVSRPRKLGETMPSNINRRRAASCAQSRQVPAALRLDSTFQLSVVTTYLDRALRSNSHCVVIACARMAE